MQDTYQWDKDQEPMIKKLFVKDCIKRMADDFSAVGRAWRVTNRTPASLPDAYVPGITRYWSVKD